MYKYKYKYRDVNDSRWPPSQHPHVLVYDGLHILVSTECTKMQALSAATLILFVSGH